jgi:hypothetical protein
MSFDLFMSLSIGVSVLCGAGMWLARPKGMNPIVALVVVAALVVTSVLVTWAVASHGDSSSEMGDLQSDRIAKAVQGADGGGAVVVLDAARLAERFYEKARDAGEVSSPVDVAQDFAAHLARVLSEYEGAGILVLNKNAALGVPPLLDVTAIVAERIGLEPEL